MIGVDQSTGAKTKEPLLSLSAYRKGKVSVKQLLQCACVYVCDRERERERGSLCLISVCSRLCSVFRKSLYHDTPSDLLLGGLHLQRSVLLTLDQR